jgi:hypothetical protein
LAFRVLDVTMEPEGGERLLGFAIDSPQVGQGANGYVLHLIGWAVARTSPARTLEVLHGDRLVRRVPIRGPRVDVNEQLGVPPSTESVFHALVNLIALEPRATLSLRVRLEDGTAATACSIELQREPLETGYEPEIAPLIVTTLGRSGSTWLMQLLASHPEIVVFRRFPFESAPAKFWSHMLRVLTEPVNLLESTQPDDFLENPWWIGANPFHDDRVYEQAPLEDWFARAHVEQFAEFTQRTVEDWYRTLGRTQVQPEPAYFAEKHMRPAYIPEVTWELFPKAKEVFLVRDFRDMADSILTFDARRGFPGFGRPPGITDEQYLRGGLHDMADELATRWTRRRDQAHLVRYEDLVENPAEVMRGLLEYLEVDSSPATLDSVLAHGSEEVLSLPGMSFEPTEVAAHRSAPDPRSTVGRRHEHPDRAVATLGDEVFAEPLSVFGYR